MSRTKLGEDSLKLRPQEPLYTACEQYDFTWTQAEVYRAKNLWRNGDDLATMARKLKRPPAEVFLLLLDLADRGKIPARENGIYGGRAIRPRVPEGVREVLGC